MKNNKPIIGIVGTPTCDDEEFSVVALYDYYRRMAVVKSFIPLMIVPMQNIDYLDKDIKEDELSQDEKNTYKEMVDMCDGIILPGGYRMYKYTFFITRYALEKNIPILGTCLGMQLFSTIDNNEYSLLKDESLKHKKRGEKYAHDVKIVPNTILSSIFDTETIKVNSFHSYYVSKVNNLVVSAYADDGKIEAVEFKDKKFAVGVQWHPEKMISYDKYANMLIDRFIMECLEYKEKLENRSHMFCTKKC